MKKLLLGTAVSLGSIVIASAQFSEIEPNSGKASATSINFTASGQTVTGFTTGTSYIEGSGDGTADYFRLTAKAGPVGVYKNVLKLNNTNNLVRIRGLRQSVGVIDTVFNQPFQFAYQYLDPDPINNYTQSSFYSFGNRGQVFYEVLGDASTVDPYVVTYTQEAVPVVNLGIFASPVTITSVNEALNLITGNQVDTDLWVYDANFTPISNYGNDDSSSSNAGSTLTRSYAPGTYYLAISRFGFANNLPAPADDFFRNGSVLDFSGVAAAQTSNSLETGSGSRNISFRISGVGDTHQQPSELLKVQDINWYKFTVGSGRNIRGKVILNDHDTNERPVTFGVYQNGILQETSVITPLADGSYVLTSATTGPVQVVAKASHWLSKIRNVLVAGSDTDIDFSLINGDTDGDNSVTIFDYIDLSNSFDLSLGDGGYNAEADLDGDDSVTIFDYIILSNNFDLTGEDVP